MTESLHPNLGENRAMYNRRRFLRSLAIGASGAALGLTACSNGPGGDELTGSQAAEPTGSDIAPAPPAGLIEGRTLVIIELEGGNDGLDTLVPYNDGLYMDLRGNVGVDPSTVLTIDDEMGLNENLAGLHSSGVAVVEGVGMADPDLSHFESSRRWWQGDITGTATFATGFLGRVCDQLHGDEPVTGVSIGRSSAPSMRSETSVTLSVPDPYSGGWLLSDDPLVQAARQGLAAMATPVDDATPLSGLARENMTKGLDFLGLLAELGETEIGEYPGSDIAYQLATCTRLLASGAGIRVLHVPWGSFDTHDEHRSSHDYQLKQLDEAILAFRLDLEAFGLDDTTLIATTSEFGRRPEQNAGGTDHGTASTMLLAGPVTAGRHGSAPSLRQLDDGNLTATVGMDEYYATLAESWFGIPAGEVLPGSPKPMPDLIA